MHFLFYLTKEDVDLLEEIQKIQLRTTFLHILSSFQIVSITASCLASLIPSQETEKQFSCTHIPTVYPAPFWSIFYQLFIGLCFILLKCFFLFLCL